MGSCRHSRRKLGREIQFSTHKAVSNLANARDRMQLHPEIDVVAAGSFKTKHPPAIRGTGFIVDSLEATLWAFYRTSSFREAVLAAANLGDDADTTAAICGQLAGAFHGESGIPEAWRNKVYKRELILGLADNLSLTLMKES